MFDAYALADAGDEKFERQGEVRTAHESVLAALQPIETGLSGAPAPPGHPTVDPLVRGHVVVVGIPPGVGRGLSSAWAR